MDQDLIFDIGMNDGSDTAFYMHKGFRVIAVEANPALVRTAERRFVSEISAGKLTIISCAIADHEGEATFYVNLDNDDHSSLDPEWGTRNGTRFETTKVRTIPLIKIIEQYGVPYYLKIDIEGADLIALRQLQQAPEKPQFISVEEHLLEYFPLLWSLGYCGFKIVNQAQHLDCDGWRFPEGSTGPFGDDIPGQWLPFGDAIQDYMLNIRDCRDQGLFNECIGWFDIHATLDVPVLPYGFPYPTRRKKPRLRSVLGRIKRRRFALTVARQLRNAMRGGHAVDMEAPLAPCADESIGPRSADAADPKDDRSRG
jgi:FkbM family methyltransferase